MKFESAKQVSYLIHRIILTIINLGPSVYLGTLYGIKAYIVWYLLFMTIWVKFGPYI